MRGLVRILTSGANKVVKRDPTQGKRKRPKRNRAAGKAAMEMPRAPGAHENRKPRSGSPFIRAEVEPKKKAHKTGKNRKDSIFP